MPSPVALDPSWASEDSFYKVGRLGQGAFLDQASPAWLGSGSILFRTASFQTGETSSGPAWLDGSFQGTFSLVYQSGASDVQQIGSYRVSVLDLAPETHSSSTFNPKEYSIVLEAVRSVR